MTLDANFVAIVQKLAAEQGAAVFLDARRCKSLMRNYCGSDYKKERRRLELVLDAGYQKLLVKADDIASAKAGIISRLQDDEGLSEPAAREITDLLELALRGKAAVKTRTMCVKCGKPLEPEWKVCPYCETTVGTVKPATVQAAEQNARVVSPVRKTKSAVVKAAHMEGFIIKNGVLEQYNGKGGDVVIPNSVTSIGREAFAHCASLTSVVIPNSVTSIGDWAFMQCTSLASVTIPNSVTSIGAWVFLQCMNLASVTIPNSVTSIGNGAFAGYTGLTAIIVDTANKNYCSVDGVLFNKSKTTLVQYPTGKPVTNYTILNSVTSIGDFAFSCCASLAGVTIPNSVTSIGDFAFSYCASLAGVTIPNSVTSIGDWAFMQCASLAGVTIPNSIISIGDGAFAGCTSLTAIIVDAANKNYCSIDGVLFNKSKTTLVQYPAGKPVTTYTILNSVTSIGKEAFAHCKSLTSVVIPNSVTSIGDFAFDGCANLVSVSIPNSVTSIGDFAFDGCPGG